MVLYAAFQWKVHAPYGICGENEIIFTKAGSGIHMENYEKPVVTFSYHSLHFIYHKVFRSWKEFVFLIPLSQNVVCFTLY